MKKIVLAILLLAGAFSAQAAPSVISGTWDRGTSKSLSLYYVVSGRLEPLVTCKLQTNQFAFAFYPTQEGFYVVGDESPVSAQNKFTFYFKPGDNLNIAVNDSTYTLTGQNTAENETLAKWQSMVQVLEWKSVYFNARFGRDNNIPSTYVDFFPLLDEVAAKVKSFHATTPNKKFNTIFESYKEYSMQLYASTFLTTPRTLHPEAEDLCDFYRNTSFDRLTATAVWMDMPFGTRMISGVSRYKAKLDGMPPVSAGGSIADVKNDTLKGEFALEGIARLKTYEEYEAFSRSYGRYMLTADQKQRFEQVGAMLAQKSKALETYKFSYPDVEGQNHSLDEFKGKVVVVDMWATWCGPCKKELPFFKKIEEEYHGKNVAFVGISVDAAKDKQKWMDFVKKEELKGTQLFGGVGCEMMNFYNINGIPRFLVYGKDGKIVTADAPRPSDPALKELIERELKK